MGQGNVREQEVLAALLDQTDFAAPVVGLAGGATLSLQPTSSPSGVELMAPVARTARLMTSRMEAMLADLSLGMSQYLVLRPFFSARRENVG
jgi:hypothetical protein